MTTALFIGQHNIASAPIYNELAGLVKTICGGDLRNRSRAEELAFPFPRLFFAESGFTQRVGQTVSVTNVAGLACIPIVLFRAWEGGDR